MPDHAFELSFDAGSEAAIGAQWEVLRRAGLPSQADHRSMTNAPHVTLAAATPIAAEIVDPAVELIGPLLPSTLTIRGLLVLGHGARVTLAHLVEPGAELAAATARLRELVPGLRHPVWTPHVTLARRLPRARLSEALSALADCAPVDDLRADRLRWWDPVAEVVRTVAGETHVDLVRLGPDDWQEFRTVRLASLADAPAAFGARYDDGVDAQEQQWRDRLVAVPLTMVARCDGAPVGVACGAPVSRGDGMELISMWVAPEHRGTGLAHRLIEHVVAWAAESGHSTCLTVREDNEAAIRTYARAGFQDRGVPADHAPDAPRERLMVRPLRGSASI